MSTHREVANGRVVALSDGEKRTTLRAAYQPDEAVEVWLRADAAVRRALIPGSPGRWVRATVLWIDAEAAGLVVEIEDAPLEHYCVFRADLVREAA